MAPPPGAYVRPAEPKDYDEAAWAMTRPFVRDPAVNWYGCVKEMFDEDVDARTISPHTLNTLPKEAKHVVQKLYTFQRALLEATVLAGGLVTVAVIPEPAGDGEQTPREVIAAVTLWLKPGQSMDFSVMTTIRSGLWKLFFTWGLTSVRRLQKEFGPAVERSLEKTFAAHNMDRWDSWHLLQTCVDPQYEGKGLCGLMMRDGFERSNPKPVHLESTTAKSRDIYAHYGFEIDEEHQFGQGAVDARGVAAKGSAATGYPEWVMTKWKYS